MPQKRLIVVVPGIRPLKDPWDKLISRLSDEAEFANSQWLYLDHGCRLYSWARCSALALRIKASIDAEVCKHQGFDDVVLIGHSMGGVVLRQAFMLAVREQDEVPPDLRWASSVSRIVLFASVNRGIDTSKSAWRKACRWLYRVFPPLRRFVTYDLLQGSDFITNLRIEWIRYFDSLEGRAPVVTQILGDHDGIVARNDSIDIEQFSTAFHITIPGAGHGDVFRLDNAPDPEGRYALILDALTNTSPVHGVQRHLAGPQKVFMVLHGIRASNSGWVDEASRLIKSKFPPNETSIKVIESSYGWFSALKFAVPATRTKNIQWFQDQYSEQMALNPRAEFNFLGHSNGTYMLGESLKNIPVMKFNRVILVGSVLPTQYVWRDRFQSGQLKYLRNERSSRDFPVGILCSALHGIGMKDIGTGGFDGFSDRSGCDISENYWYNGGHSAPLLSANLNRLIDDLVSGTPVPPAALEREGSRLYLNFSRRVPRLAQIIALGGVFGALWWVFRAPGFSWAHLLYLAAAGIVVFVLIDLS
jgi:alpha/beta hydrolase family protein